MNPSPKIEPVSTEQLLDRLDFAIDEAKLVRTLDKSRDMVIKLKKENPFSDQLVFLNIHITYLEAKLVQIRGEVKRT